ncbi:MAG: tetratricopeptide repeat protein [Candidatus Babeliales bacterium]
MNKKLLIKNIKDLTKMYYLVPIGERDAYSFEIMRNLIEEYLEKNPKDTEVWLRLAMLEFTPPFEDPEMISEYLYGIFKYDPYNIYATITLACIQDVLRGEITEEIFEKLNTLSSDSPELNSMIELEKAKYYQCKDNDALYEKYLLNSIRDCNKHVKNYKYLAYLYKQQGKKKEAKQLAQKALSNVKVIYGENSPITDVTDIEEFINEYIKGTHITDSNLKSIYKLLQ